MCAFRQNTGKLICVLLDKMQENRFVCFKTKRSKTDLYGFRKNAAKLIFVLSDKCRKSEEIIKQHKQPEGS